MYGISFCSGYGGLELGLQEAAEVEVVAYIEREPYPQAILIKRMQEGYLTEAPIYDDLRTFNGRPYHGLVDFMFGGIPCQPHSVAGKRRGATDERNLWPDTERIIGEVGPKYVFLENVPGIVSNGFIGEVVTGLAKMGYDCAWTIVSASQIGAPHKRERWFCLGVLADSELRGCVDGQPKGQSAKARKQAQRDISAGRATGKIRRQAGYEVVSDSDKGGWREDFKDLLRREQDTIRRSLSDSDSVRQLQQKGSKPLKRGRLRDSSKEDVSYPHPKGLQGRMSGDGWQESFGLRGRRLWERDPADEPEASESFVGRVVDGCPARVDRLKCLGNAVVPQQAAYAWKMLTNQTVVNRDDNEK